MIPEPPLRIAVAGANGRMGGEVIRLIAGDPRQYSLVAAWVSLDSDKLGVDAGELTGCLPLGVVCTAPQPADIDVVVDFTAVQAVPQIAGVAVECNAPLVSGVTGLDDPAKKSLSDAAAHVPVLHANNFSLGVAVLKELAVLARERLGDAFDIEIDEIHHRGKRDAPSGTARMLGQALGDSSTAVRTGPRETRGEIGYSVRRGGQVPGEHTVYFLGAHETLELRHRAGDRALFAAGALAVSGWLFRQRARQYCLEDYLLAR